MIRKAVITGQVRSGLRTRYFPKSRIGHGLISLAPWLNLVLLLIFFLLIDSKIVLQPGVDIKLPEAPFKDGSVPGMPLVVLSIGPGGGPREEVIVFDDQRFLPRVETQMQRLREILGKRARALTGVPLVIHADARVSHGTVLDLVRIAREAGVPEVNFASRALDAGRNGARTP
jgi:biopolymer transport protein ExbD